MVPGQGAASGTRSQGSVRVAADGGAPDATPPASAAKRAPAVLGAALLPQRGHRGEELRGLTLPAAATRTSGVALAAAAAGAVSVAAAGGLLCVEQHLRSHARFFKALQPELRAQ